MTTRPNSIGINIEGSKVDTEGTAQMAQSIIDVLEVGYETHADQNTLQVALDLLGKTMPAVVGGQTISGCSISLAGRGASDRTVAREVLTDHTS